jgi:hypothetical protein
VLRCHIAAKETATASTPEFGILFIKFKYTAYPTAVAHGVRIAVAFHLVVIWFHFVSGKQNDQSLNSEFYSGNFEKRNQA